MERTQQIDDFVENLPQFYKRIEGYLYRIVHSKDTASDLTQDTFLRILENLDQFEAQTKSIDAWVYTIARNIAYDHGRRSRAQANSFPRLRSKTQINPTPEEIINGEELLDFADNNLNERQKQVAKLRGKGYSHREIGKILGVKKETSKVIIHRAKKKMRQYC